MFDGTIIANILMKQSDRICHKIVLRSTKQLDSYIQREENYIEGTPKIIIAKQIGSSLQEIWTDDLKNQSLTRLKDLNSNQKAFCYARRIIIACAKLAPRYGFFIINENMVFFNQKGQIFVWINPQILQNRVKIYLPSTTQGESVMTRSIVTYLKLWLRFDYQHLSLANNLNELLVKFEAVRTKALERGRNKSPSKWINDQRPSFNFEEINQNLKALRIKINQKNQTKENNLLNKITLNKSTQKVEEVTKQSCKLFLSFPNKEKRNGNIKPSLFNQQKKLKFKTSFGTYTQGHSLKSQPFDPDFQYKTFNNYPSNTSTNNSFNQSVGLKSGSNYFPNRTTSNKNKNHPIVQLINSQDNTPDQYCQNKILINAVKEDQENLRKLKQSLEGIGEEVNELFLSNIESQQHKEEQLKVIAAEFQNLLN